MNDVEVQKIFGHSLDLHDARIAELKYFFAIGTYQVIVLFVLVRFLKLGHVLAKLVFDHQAGIYQDLNIIIQGGPTYPVFFILHEQVQLFNIKMPLVRIDLVKYSVAFRCFSMLMSL